MEIEETYEKPFSIDEFETPDHQIISKKTYLDNLLLKAVYEMDSNLPLSHLEKSKSPLPPLSKIEIIAKSPNFDEKGRVQLLLKKMDNNPPDEFHTIIGSESYNVEKVRKCYEKICKKVEYDFKSGKPVFLKVY